MRKRVLFFRIFVGIFALFLIVYFQGFSFSESQRLSLYSIFVGKKSEYNGMIEIWNIDTFESGNSGKVDFLETQAKSFQKKNKGLYILVRNISLAECKNMIEMGQFPDLISCSYPCYEIIKNKISCFSNNDCEVFDNFYEAGKKGNELYGLAWCYGIYTLISTNEKLQKASINLKDGKLSEYINNAEYEYKVGKKSVVSKSVAFGKKNNLLPEKAFYAYSNIEIIKSLIQENEIKSQYSAYCDFISNRATILLGTQRDIFRIENRKKLGKIQDVIYEPLLAYTDLVQFIFISKNIENIKREYAEKFAFSLVSKDVQSKLKNIGLFSVTNIDSDSIMQDIIPDKFSILEVKSLF